MKWYEKIIAVHTAITNSVSHGQRMQSTRYFVWQEDGNNAFLADNTHQETAVTGTTDLYTKMEFDPWKDAFESSLNSCRGITWRLNSIQFEKETGFWHYEWIWSVM